MDARIAALLDKQDIYEVLAHFMRACDRGDPESLRRCYHPGAVEDHAGGYLGDAHAWIDSIEPVLVYSRTVMTQVLSNVLIDVDGDVAARRPTSRQRVGGVSRASSSTSRPWCALSTASSAAMGGGRSCAGSW